MSYCQSCKCEYLESVSDCPGCGVKLTPGDPAFCPSCEEEILHEVITCPHCGILLGWKREDEEEIQCQRHESERAVGRCIVCATSVCGDCARRRGGKVFCEEHHDLKVAFDWVAVHSASTQVEAHLMKGHLLAANIPALLLSQHDRMYTTTLGDLALTEVMVQKSMFTEAKQFLDALALELDAEDESN